MKTGKLLILGLFGLLLTAPLARAEDPHALAEAADARITPRLSAHGKELLSQAQADEARAAALRDRTIPGLSREQWIFERHERMHARRLAEFDPYNVSRDRMAVMREAAALEQEAAVKQDDCTSIFSVINWDEYCNEAARLRARAEERRRSADRIWRDYDDRKAKEDEYQAAHRKREQELADATAELPRLLAEALELRKLLSLELAHPPGRVAGRHHVNRAEIPVAGAEAAPNPGAAAGGAAGGT